MHRRRTALSAAAVALLATAPLLTACGSAAHPGAAAVVGKERITESQLQAQVKEVRDAQRDSPQAAQLVASSPRLGQDTLIRMIQYRIVAKAGRENGITVTRRDVQQQRAALEKANGGAQAVQARFLSLGVAPDQIDQAIAMDYTRGRLDQKLGSTRANNALMSMSKSIGVDINPRYGTWDAKRGTTQPAQEAWLRADAPVAEQPA
jgi:hypothetical protein